LREEIVDSERIYAGRIVTLRKDTVRLEDGRVATREIIEHRPAVAIVPITDDGRIVLVRQWRVPANAELLEVPAGVIEPDEDIEVGLQRELQEETGYRAARVRRLAGFFVAPGYTTEFIHVYLAEGLSESRLQADEDEEITVELHTLDEALALIQRGEIRDGKSIIGLYALALERTLHGR
jgi:ADP-ribose pyrophosphatase